MSSVVMYVMIGFYAVITVCAAWERNWWRVLYFIAAIMISIAVLGMSHKQTAEAKARGPPQV